MAKILVTVIVVTYNSSKYINRCLKSVGKHPVIVVDNDSKDNSVEIARKYRAKIVKNKRNIGYARATNVGIRKSKTKYVLLINPDVYFRNDSIKKMLSFMEKNKKYDVQGPKLLNEKGKLIYSCRRFPTVKAMIGNRLGFFRKDVRKYLMKDYDHKKPIKVDWVSGGCMMFKNKYLLDGRYFLYFEDVDFCIEKNVWYNPNAAAYHTVQRQSKRSLGMFFRHFCSWLKFAFKN